MRLPTRGRQVVAAISEIRRLVPKPDPDTTELRKDAMRLYRTIVRTLQRAPPSASKTEVWGHARVEFIRNRELVDPQQIQHCLSVGWNEYEMLGRYFEEQRHFVKPLLTRQFPEKRVEMLKSLLKITPVDKRQRVQWMLYQAERKAEARRKLDATVRRAERALDNGVALEDEARAAMGMPPTSAQYAATSRDLPSQAYTSHKWG